MESKLNLSEGTSQHAYCDAVFDGLLFWPKTAAGTTANHSCPTGMGFVPFEFAYKVCWENGSWYVNSENQTWTNYLHCINDESDQFLTMTNKLNVTGYSISLAALVISLWIFIQFRTLHCIRNRIHVQLFLSFTLNSIMWIIWYERVVPDAQLTNRNDIWCQIHHIIKEYFMVVNYMWMFCEALHLHLSLVVVFLQEEVTMKWFYWIGWGIPANIVLVHCLVRFFVAEDTDKCWMNETAFSHWFLSVPICITLLASLIFLINVLRVLLMIMHPHSLNPAPMGIRRAARAALILIPLFGLQHFLIPVRPDDHHPLLNLYEIISAVIVSFQGLVVACLFCFANTDVQHAIRSFIQQKIHQSSRWGNYAYNGTVETGDNCPTNGNSQTNNIALLNTRTAKDEVTT